MKPLRLDRAIALGAGLAALAAMLLTWQSPVAWAILKGGRINGLLIGSDYSDYARHSDTMMLVSYDAGRRFLDVVSIPRDTMVSLPERPGIRRINEVFTYEFKHSGRNFTMASLALARTLEVMLSSGTPAPLQIPYFFTIDYNGFRNFIDAIGGVTVRVTEPMHYDDSWGKLHIHFDPGEYHLNGQKALEYVRFRGASADQGRQRRQQLFIREVVSRMKRPEVLWGLPRQAQAILRGFHTNLSLPDLLALAWEARQLKASNMRLMSVPGEPYGVLWRMNVEKTASIMGLLQAPAPGTKHAMTASLAAAEGMHGGRPTVEVWNASNTPVMAQRVARRLRESGFDVVRYGNFSTRQAQTLVLDRSGDLRPAQAVALALSRAQPEVVSRPDFTLQVDVSVIIGNDFKLSEGLWR